jgi:two-component system cell cycle response regulator
MDETPNPYETFPAIATISELLSQTVQTKFVGSAQGVCQHVLIMKSEEFATLSDFKSAYLACEQPVLCLVRPVEVADVITWLRESDDIALAGEAETLTDWRLDRISKTFAKRLDPLTQVHRRGQLIRSLDPICETAGPDQPVSLILLDIDHFKLLNDRLGARVGDEILSNLGRLIQTLCQKTLVARTRGGEFGVIVEAEETVAKAIANSIRESVDRDEWCKYPEITASFGVASVVESCLPSMVLTQADEALFAAKAHGRNRVVCFSEIASVSNRNEDELEVVSMENKARVLGERVTSFVAQRSNRIMQSLRREANTDGLTKLFNLRYLDKQLEE